MRDALLILFGVFLGFTGSTIYFVAHEERLRSLWHEEHEARYKAERELEYERGRSMTANVELDRIRREWMKNRQPPPMIPHVDDERIPPQAFPTVPSEPLEKKP